MTEPMLCLKAVSRSFGAQVVIDQVSLVVNQGDVYGFLGPNGAGKTTTIRMIFGLIKPTAGEIWVAGVDVARQRLEALRKMGGIIEYPVFPGYFTARELLHYLGVQAGGVAEKRIDEVLGLVGLSEASNKVVRTFSLGMKQRLGIAQAILNRPSLIVLDEPTNGLDPAGIIEIRNLIRQLAQEQGVTVFVSSHQLHEVQLICNRVGILNKGKLIAEGEVAQLLHRDTVPVIVQTTQVAAALAAMQLATWIDRASVDPESPHKIVAVVRREYVDQLNRFLMERDVLVQAIQPREVTLEDFFIEKTGGQSHVALSTLGNS